MRLLVPLVGGHLAVAFVFRARVDDVLRRARVEDLALLVRNGSLAAPGGEVLAELLEPAEVAVHVPPLRRSPRVSSARARSLMDRKPTSRRAESSTRPRPTPFESSTSASSSGSSSVSVGTSSEDEPLEEALVELSN